LHRCEFPRSINPIAVLALLLLGALGRGAAADPLTTLEAELDGDGRPDLVRLAGDGGLELQLSSGPRPGSPALRPHAGARPLRRARLSAARAPGLGAIVVAAGANAARAEQAVALRLGNGALLEELWRGPVGPHGPDGEHTVVVEATPWGLIRYQQRPGVERCDGAPAQLFAERFDPERRQFAPAAAALRAPPQLPLLRARPAAAGRREQLEAALFRASAASSQAGAQSATDLAPPRELDDRQPETLWREGRTGFGRGEFVTAVSVYGEVSVRALRLTLPGPAAGLNRLRRALLLLGPEHAFRLDLGAGARAGGASLWIELPAPVRSRCATLAIEEVEPARGVPPGSGTTAIAELAVLTEIDLAAEGADAVLAARIAAGASDADRARVVLASRGDRAARALHQTLGRAALDDAARLRLRLALSDVTSAGVAADPASAAELVAGLRMDAASAADRQALARGLREPAATDALAGLARDPEAAEETRALAMSLLARMPGTEAGVALRASAGQGSRALRRELALAVATRPSAEMPALLEAIAAARDAGALAAEADLWRAIGLAARRTPAADKKLAATALAQRLASAGDYELRYRLLEAAGPLDEASALAAAGAAIGDRSPGPRATALRRVAVTALGKSSQRDATEQLRAALADPDPGVRHAALVALGERDGGAAEAAILGRLRDERWPRLRLAAAAALGRQCHSRAVLRGLEETVWRDPDTEVRRTGLAALADCRPPQAVALLLRLVRHPGQPRGVRTQAARLLGQHAGPGRTGELAALLAELRQAAGDHRDTAEVAATLALALGELRHRSAIEALLAAAADATFVEIQAAAVTALGRHCPAAATPLLARLRGSSEPAVAMAARSAATTCARRRTRGRAAPRRGGVDDLIP
jgi:HEAT repeat protein